MMLHFIITQQVTTSTSNMKLTASDLVSETEFREKRHLTGESLEKALWLANMELQRLQKWVPAAKQVASGDDIDIKL